MVEQSEFLNELKRSYYISEEKIFVNIFRSIKVTKAKSHGPHLLNELNILRHEFKKTEKVMKLLDY